MKKTVLNFVLYGLMIILSITICVLIIKIVNRPRYVSPEPEALVIQEIPYEQSVSSNTIEENTTGDALGNTTVANADDYFSPNGDTSSNTTSAPAVVDTPANTKHGKTSTKVNIREQANDQARILETVEEGYTFDIIEILDSGWVKIAYGDSSGYISSKYVILLAS